MDYPQVPDALPIEVHNAATLERFFDTNALYTLGATQWPVFDKIYTRPAELGDPDFGRRTSAFIGQDAGDVFALLAPGYNFDGTQNPVVIRLGD